MAYLDDAQDALDEAYAQFGLPALWTPAGGAPQAVTVIPDQGDGQATFEGLGRRVVSRNVFRIRVSEALTVSPTVEPAKEDAILVGSFAGTLVNKPLRRGPMQLEWVLEAT